MVGFYQHTNLRGRTQPNSTALNRTQPHSLLKRTHSTMDAVIRQLNAIINYDGRSLYNKFSDDKGEWAYELRWLEHGGKATPKWLVDLNGTRNAEFTTAGGSIVAYNQHTGKTASCYGGCGSYVDAESGNIEFGGMFATDCWGGRCAYTGRTYWVDFQQTY